MGNPLINRTRRQLKDYDLTPATTSTRRCCGTAICDARERRKISSNTARSLASILIRLLGEHYHGEKTDTQLLLASGSFETVYICRQSCLYALQRFQKLEWSKACGKQA